MPFHGYARVSTLDQDLGIQRAALKAAGCKVVRAETASGSKRGGRTELEVLLDFAQPGNTLVVTCIDRLARSMKDLQGIVHGLKTKGAALRATGQPVDTGTAASKEVLQLLCPLDTVGEFGAGRLFAVLLLPTAVRSAVWLSSLPERCCDALLSTG